MSFEEAPIGMAVLKPSGELMQANRSMAAMLGYERESLLGLNISALVHVDDQAELGEAWEMMGNSSEHVAAEWMRCLTAQGGAIWGRVSLSLVPRTPGQSAMVVFQLEDATNAYQERRELESLLKGKDEFVAAVGDEIRQPLDLLIDLTELADHPHADTRDTLPRIEAHARQIASIVDDLVVSARAGAAPIPVVARRLDAVALSREVVTRIPAADRVRLELNAGELWADPGLTRQILHNLIANALTYGGPDVTLRTAASGPDTVIQIIDNGPEVPEPERVFSGDLRSGRPVTKPAAVGLGLTVGRHLARLMEGDVEYRRTTGGENVFELRLPSEALSEIPKPRDHSQGLGLPV
jgi:PAS domain S-box-containing protein